MDERISSTIFYYPANMSVRNPHIYYLHLNAIEYTYYLNFQVAILTLVCLMTIIVAGQDEWEEFYFGLDESLLYEDSYGSASTLPVAAATKFNNNSVIFPTSPAEESDPEPEPEPKSPTAAIHAVS